MSRCGRRGHLRADCRTPPSPRRASNQARDRAHALAQPDSGATRQLIEDPSTSKGKGILRDHI
ncbi:hypothetical protein Syun_014409 [Stephania yunnanensis]|uniref:Uncharacterized protein n=1 Tax=Stephania yunnanensis TaxID=152371 RepID=A0AAP0JJP4_9MAGN